jgi:hypothetical protein
MQWNGYGRKRSWPNLKYCPGICLERLRKTTKNLSQDSRSPGRGFHPGPPEYEVGVLTTRPHFSDSSIATLRKLKKSLSYGRPVYDGVRSHDYPVCTNCRLRLVSSSKIWSSFRDTRGSTQCLPRILTSRTDRQATLQ